MRRTAVWGVVAALVASACGPAVGPVREPSGGPGGVEPGDAGSGADAEPPGPPEDAGPLPGPPGADPPGFEPFEPLPEGVELVRALWKVEGTLAADALRDGVSQAIAGVGRCLAGASPGGRLPLHLIVGVDGRVVEVGGPLAAASMREAITCAQEALRMLRFPEAEGETTVRLIVER